ncbi:MAG: phospho-N-acetylmuramoyl-pentapeptide-transferase [Oscillospiraceae bacterium]|jgi:phospho-N-acetylmuramoyl-pentapeptide-transferase
MTLYAFAAAFVLSLILGKFIIPMLRRMDARQSIKEIGPKWHMSKQGTPMMGGIIFIAASGAATIAFGWNSMKNGNYIHLFIFGMALIFGLVGFADDYVKVKKKQNTGLTVLQKLLLQIAVAVAFIALLRYFGHLSSRLYIPFLNVTWELPWIVYTIIAAFIIVGFVNAVNITDGIDGLAAGVTTPVALFFAAAAYYWSNQAVGLFAAALAGALIGFLFYNYHPARVFMGDTGSLFLGGSICGLAFALDIPLILVPVGIIYLIETMSDIIQVLYFKATGGKRVFLMAPLHHHFEMKGWKEGKIFWTFTLITVAFCLLGFWALTFKYMM